MRAVSYFIFIEFPLPFQFVKKMAPLKPVGALALLVVAVLLASELLVSPALAEVTISAALTLCYILSCIPKSISESS